MNEIGAVVCRLSSGALVLGPVVEGTPENVRVPLICPPGAEPVGFWHTHPEGSPRPSLKDVSETAKLGLDFVCATKPETGQTRCALIP